MVAGAGRCGGVRSRAIAGRAGVRELLASGERLEVIKNFPTDSFLRKKLATATKEIRIDRLEHYWLLTARLK